MWKDKAIVAVMPLYDDERQSYWMLPGYMKSLEQQGAIPLMLPLTDNRDELDYFLETCDGFMLTGGQDVSPEIYNENPIEQCGAVCRPRDDMDAYILKQAAQMDKAVLGICRGIQLMNAAYGGTLYQDLPLQHPSPVGHHMQAPYNRSAHTVKIMDDSPLKKLLGVSECEVNSYHHQAVRDLAPCLKAMAVSPDGLVEAVYMPSKRFVWGVQWHPELSYHNDMKSREIIGAFLRAALA